MKIYGTHDARTIEQLQRCVDAQPGALGVLCADGHVGYSMPIGGVVAYRGLVSPSGVGYDIACGNLAVQTNIMMKDIPGQEREAIADEIQRRVSFGIGRTNAEPLDHPVLEEIAQADVREQKAMAQMAANQLGTVGSGNHYVDVLEDEAGVLWVVCHFGSRGFGHKTAKGFMNIAAGRAFDDGKGDGEMDAPPLLLDALTPSGEDYIRAMQLAGRYAYAGREAVVAKVLSIIGAEAEFAVHNHHNFAWEERHTFHSGHGTSVIDYWVVRKGATPAFPGQFGFVGGSMGDISVILKGVDSPESCVRASLDGSWRWPSDVADAGSGAAEVDKGSMDVPELSAVSVCLTDPGT